MAEPRLSTAEPNLADRNRKWSPSDRNSGQRCEVCPLVSVLGVTGVAWLPSAFTLQIGPPASGAKRMTFLALQLPPRGWLVLASICAGPPVTAIFSSFPLANNATYASSGDQNG